MEKAWHDYMGLPKEQKKGMEYGGHIMRPAIFDDIYLSYCQKLQITADEKIRSHFWNNCVGMQEYMPKYCSAERDWGARIR